MHFVRLSFITFWFACSTCYAVDCSLILSGQGSSEPGSVSLTSKALNPIQSFLAKRFTSLVPGRIASIQSQLDQLVPTSAYDRMANLYQKPYDYVLEWLPAPAKLGPAQDLASRRKNSAFWKSRLTQATKLLNELSVLQKNANASDADLINTQLKLGLIYSFTDADGAGFQTEEAAMGGMKALKTALGLAETSAQREGLSVNYIRYLYAKHCDHVAATHSNAGVYSFAGGQLTQVAPTKNFHPLMNEARNALRETMHALSSELNSNTFSTDTELFFMTLFEMTEHIQVWKWAGSHLSSDGLNQIREAILIELIRRAPETWINAQLNGQESFFKRLFSSIRQYHHYHRHTENWELLYYFDLSLGSKPQSRESLIQVLKDFGMNLERDPLSRLRSGGQMSLDQLF